MNLIYNGVNIMPPALLKKARAAVFYSISFTGRFFTAFTMT